MLKCLITSAGGIDGTLGTCLRRAGLPVSFLAHSKTLEAPKKKGLTLIKDSGEETFSPVAASDGASYNKTPDVIFLALKSYSVESVLPFLKRIVTGHTVIIPLCDVFGTGEELQKKLKKPLVTGGCIYVMGNVEGAGKVRQLGNLMCVVYGIREPEGARPVLEEMKAELTRADVEVMLSDNIRHDCMEKFAYLSPHGAIGTYFYVMAAHLQREGGCRNFYRGLVHGVLAIVEKTGIAMDGYNGVDDPRVADELTPEVTTSFQKGVADVRRSEVDGLTYEVQCLGAAYGTPTSYYDEVIEALRLRGVERGVGS